MTMTLVSIIVLALLLCAGLSLIAVVTSLIAVRASLRLIEEQLRRAGIGPTDSGSPRIPTGVYPIGKEEGNDGTYADA